MLAGNAYLIRAATSRDEPMLRRLAYLDSQRPLTGPVLVGEVDGLPAAAMSLSERRMIADPFQATFSIRLHLRTRAAALEAYERTPSLADRIRAAMRGERLVPHIAG